MKSVVSIEVIRAQAARLALAPGSFIHILST
jgi:hypothetical protein